MHTSIHKYKILTDMGAGGLGCIATMKGREEKKGRGKN